MKLIILPKLKKYLLVFTVLFSFNTYSQDVLLSETVDSSYQIKSFGPNRTHFVHSYFTFGFIIGDTEQKSIETKFWSNKLGLGIRYKLRILNHLATGAELEYNLKSVFYPTNSPVIKDKYYISDFKYAWYGRINFGKRGDIMGKYIDLGIWASSTTQSRKYIKTKVSNLDFEYLEENHTKLKYINKFNYGFLARLGVNQFVLFVEYRYSDFLKKDFYDTYSNIPPWTIGLQVGLHR